MPRTDPARLVAFEVLRAVADKDAYANLELSRLLRERGLGGRDAALATELVGGTLRLAGSYDDILDRLVKGSLQPAVRDALRLGAHQLLSMRVPTHAAVTTTVDLVKEQVGHKPAGLVNAVLRKVSAHDLDTWLVDRSLAARTSHPQWIIDALAEALDRPAEIESLLEADNVRPAVVLVAATPNAGSILTIISCSERARAQVFPARSAAAIPRILSGRIGARSPERASVQTVRATSSTR